MVTKSGYLYYIQLWCLCSLVTYQKPFVVDFLSLSVCTLATLDKCCLATKSLKLNFKVEWVEVNGNIQQVSYIPQTIALPFRLMLLSLGNIVVVIVISIPGRWSFYALVSGIA